MKLVEQKVRDYIALNNMLSDGDGIVVGVSGGADSVCLIAMLASFCGECSIKLTAVHVHHGIRGPEADRDMHFTRELCDKLGVKLIIKRYDVPEYARLNKLSDEEAGRRLRYQAFREVLVERGYDKIAVAHHIEDSAETILFNMIRGSRAAGLRGILPVNGEIIRPLMCLTRTEIEQYLNECNIKWCNDSTNASEEYSRNRIRETIIPAMKMINDRAVQHIIDSGKFIGEMYDYLAENVEELYTRTVRINGARAEIDVETLKAAHRLERLEVIKKAVCMVAGSLKDITALHIEAADELILKQSGRRIDLPYNIELVREHAVMYVHKKNVPLFEAAAAELAVDVTKAGAYKLPYGYGMLYVRPVSEENINFKENVCTKFMDCDRIEDILMLRTRRSGDYLMVNHGQSKKKLKEYFIDNKIPASERDRMLLLADGSHVLWVLGHRMSDGGKLSANTKRTVEFRWEEHGTEEE